MGKHVVLTFDDACRSHLTVAMPELLKRGFGATFFVCRFTDEWRAAHASELLTAPEIKTLADAGFDIGNHTWNHPSLLKLPTAEIRSELGRLRDFLRAAGVPDATNFAYPGGPYAANAVPVIREFGFRFARIAAETSLYDPAATDPMQVPSFPLHHSDRTPFRRALDQLDAAPERRSLILLFHGVPDTVHEHVTTPREVFIRDLDELVERGYRVTGMDQLPGPDAQP